MNLYSQNDDGQVDVDDTVKKMADGDVADAIKDDAEQTKEDMHDASAWAKDKIDDLHKD